MNNDTPFLFICYTMLLQRELQVNSLGFALHFLLQDNCIVRSLPPNGAHLLYLYF